MNQTTVRVARSDDLFAITSLFETTIKAINIRDYSPEEVEVWSSFSQHKERWIKKMKELTFAVAEIDKQVVGFSSIAKDGYLDHMFVHKDHQRQGIATGLLLNVEEIALKNGNTEVYVHVSRTAVPFFEARGYEIKGQVRSEVKGILFINSLMKKAI